MTTIDKVRFSRALKRFREQKDLTQLELAEKLSTTSNTIARWERGETVPRNRLTIKHLRDFGIKW